jgi:tryptophan-rich sensory protein
MMSQLQDFVAAIEGSAIADSIRENDVLFPLIESIHVIAISLVVGSILVLDLRLLGVASLQRPVNRLANSILPVTWGAFAVAAVSGLLLFISNASKYLANGYFDAKLCLIAAAGLNMMIFHGISAREMAKWDHEKATPVSAWVAGALSILIWIAVVACGRLIGFTMDSL